MPTTLGWIGCDGGRWVAKVQGTQYCSVKDPFLLPTMAVIVVVGLGAAR